jgi:hypothetical protein
MSEYVRDLRSRIGTTVLEIPTVSILAFDGSSARFWSATPRATTGRRLAA